MVICHRNADADSYLSAYAISKLLRRLAPKCKVEIAAPGGLATLTSKLAETFPHRLAVEGTATYDLYVAVDVGDAELLGEWRQEVEEAKVERILIDHHPLRTRHAYDHVIVDEDATSAAEVVYGLFASLGIRMDRLTAQALLEGIMFDSSHLAIASEGALRAVVELFGRGADLQLARRQLRSEPDYGEVMAKLKGARRMKLFKLGNWVAATTKVGSYQAHVARSLVFMGADFASVGGTTDGETRVSMRSSQRFFDQTKIHLGTDVAAKIAPALGGHGGGHGTAASFSCTQEEEVAISSALSRVAELLVLRAEEIE